VDSNNILCCKQSNDVHSCLNLSLVECVFMGASVTKSTPCLMLNLSDSYMLGIVCLNNSSAEVYMITLL
jgi:hypothetical protein